MQGIKQHELISIMYSLCSMLSADVLNVFVVFSRRWSKVVPFKPTELLLTP